jgi:hypothetical protein
MPGPAVPPSAGWAPPVAPPPSAGFGTTKPQRRRDPLTIVLFLAAFVAIGGVGFAAGRVTAPTPQVATRGFGGNGANGFQFPGNSGGTGNGGTGSGGTANGAAGGFGRFGSGLSVRGTVSSITSSELTLTLANGGTVNIPIDSSTTYHAQAAATSGDVTTGATVLVQVAVGGGGANGAGPGGSAVPGQPGTGQGGTGRSLGTAEDITVVGP